ncbi:hypothetical protein C8R44DRAFT_856346 [Mycena epipterygia]|nr:hypothetical protein C8R44DRAFT_856346 [Mycena epipterygia]
MQRLLSRCSALEELSFYLGAPEISALVAFTYPALRRVRLKVNPDEWHAYKHVLKSQFEVLQGGSFPGLEEITLHDPTKSLVQREVGRRSILGMVARGCRVMYDNGEVVALGFTLPVAIAFATSSVLLFVSRVYVLPRREIPFPSRSLPEKLQAVFAYTNEGHAYPDFSGGIDYGRLNFKARHVSVTRTVSMKGENTSHRWDPNGIILGQKYPSSGPRKRNSEERLFASPVGGRKHKTARFMIMPDARFGRIPP